jgi:hypothetical protein
MRSALRRAARTPAMLASARSLGSAPKVLDVQVALTAVLPDGRRMPLIGRVGMTVASALRGSPLPELSACAPLIRYAPALLLRSPC